MRYTGRLAGSALVGAALLLSVPGGAASAATLPTLPITGLTQFIADSVHNELFLASANGVVVTGLTGVKITTWGAGEGTGSIATDGTSVYVVESTPGEIAAFSALNPTAAPAAYTLPAGDIPSSVAFQANKIWVSYSNPTVNGAIGYFAAGATGTFHAAALSTAVAWPTAPRLAADPNPATEGTLVAVDNEADPTQIATYNVSGNAFLKTPLAENDAFAACTGLSDLAVTAGGGDFVLACTGETALTYTRTLVPVAAPAVTEASIAAPSAVAIAPDNTGVALGTSGTAAKEFATFKTTGAAVNSYPAPAAGDVVAKDGLAWAGDAVKLYAVLKNGGNYYLDTLIYAQYLASNLDLVNTGTGTWAAGTKLTLKGTLKYATASGVGTTIPPVGTTVRILRRLTTSNVNTTLYVKTGIGGAYTVTDTPNPGSYYYVAYYPGTSTYSPAWHTVADKVTIARTTLKVTAGTTLVKKGTTITVTAHLGKWHTNRTVSIYATPAGGRKTLLKTGAVNAQGLLAVKYKMEKNTLFTVTYAGDAWYAKAQVSGTVKVQ